MRTDRDEPLVVITSWVHPEVHELLAGHARVAANRRREAWSREETFRRCREATAMMAFMSDHVDPSFLEACPDLRMIACALKGYDNFDVEACARRGVVVSIVPDLLTEPSAELTVGLLIALGRRIVDADRHLRAATFRGWRPRFYGVGLAGGRVGILGMGAIGAAVARRLAGFGAELVYHDPRRLPAARERELRVRALPLEELLATSDAVVVAVPLNPGTVHLLGREALARMKPGALLVNTGRGSVVDEVAVAEALRANRLGGYAADVFEMEDWARPGRPRHIPRELIRQADRTVLTPHIGSAVDAVRRDIALSAAGDIVEFLEGRRPLHALPQGGHTGRSAAGQGAAMRRPQRR